MGQYKLGNDFKLENTNLDELFVVISNEPGEGIVAIHTETGIYPMVISSLRFIDEFKNDINTIAKNQQKELYLVKYKKDELIEIFTPVKQ